MTETFRFSEDLSPEACFPGNYVRIMVDYSCEPCWSCRGGDSPLEALPVSPALRTALRAWADAYETTVGWPDDGVTVFDIEAFSRQGLMLARRVKDELPHWTVIFWDDAATHRNEPRWMQQFEIA
jgi:hypothetical protein